MSFHEELNQKLNVFFNRDWFVVVVGTGRGKEWKNSRRSCERFWLGYGFSCSVQIAERKLPDTGVCNEFRTSVLGILVVGITRLKSHTRFIGYFYYRIGMMWKNMIRIRTYWIAFRAVY